MHEKDFDKAYKKFLRVVDYFWEKIELTLPEASDDRKERFLYNLIWMCTLCLRDREVERQLSETTEEWTKDMWLIFFRDEEEVAINQKLFTEKWYTDAEEKKTAKYIG